VDMLYIEFGQNQFVGLAAIGKKHTGNGRRTHATGNGRRTHATGNGRRTHARKRK
jgi:hypothetical protein